MPGVDGDHLTSVGNQLAVSYMEELYPVTVLTNDATPPFDPDNERVKRPAL